MSIYRDAVTKFNIKPKACRDFLIAKKVIQGLPSELAQFIIDQPKLSKRRIGEYIGGLDRLNQCVCDELFSRYDFRGDTLDCALRKLLRQFRLPGEAQQIDRCSSLYLTSLHFPFFILPAHYWHIVISSFLTSSLLISLCVT